MLDGSQDLTNMKSMSQMSSFNQALKTFDLDQLKTDVHGFVYVR